MQLDFSDNRPIFLQLAEQIEEGILSGAFPEESQIPSTTEIATHYKINPATALKGINLLVENDTVYKKRGVGMFVSTGAVTKIRQKRKQAFFQDYIASLLAEAQRLGIGEEEIITMIKEGERS